MEIGTTKDLKRAILKLISEYKQRGAVGIKSGHAYWRTLYHQEVSEAQSGRVLGKLVAGRKTTEAENKALSDWAFREAVRTAGEMGMVVQIHTGVQTNWGHMPDSDPTHLLNMLNEFREVKFDLFHAGYPYARQLGMIGKHFPNVWLNMCWMYLISTAASRQILSEWLDLVPAYRLLGFGSDTNTPELVYAHLVMARECLAVALAEKVEKDYWSKERAREVGRMMLLNNPCELYAIKPPATRGK